MAPATQRSPALPTMGQEGRAMGRLVLWGQQCGVGASWLCGQQMYSDSPAVPFGASGAAGAAMSPAADISAGSVGLPFFVSLFFFFPFFCLSALYRKHVSAVRNSVGGCCTDVKIITEFSYASWHKSGAGSVSNNVCRNTTDERRLAASAVPLSQPQTRHGPAQ